MIQILNKSIAYVASAMPISLLDKKITDWNIGVIIVENKFLDSSLTLKLKHPSLKVLSLSEKIVINIIQVFIIFIYVKIFKNHIFFFHECCCPIFDVLIKIIKPCGEFYPQVSLCSFKLVDMANLVPPKNIKHKIIELFGINKLFNYYTYDLDNNAGVGLVMQIKKYPHSIKINNIEYSWHVKALSVKSSPKEEKAYNNLMFLLGSDIITLKNQFSILNEIILYSQKIGYTCYSKDHPNLLSRSSLYFQSVEQLAPEIPIEIIEDEYDFIIGFGSTGLLWKPHKAISLLSLVDTFNLEKINYRINHLLALPGSNQIFFPKTMIDVFDRLLSYKNK